MAYSPQEKAEIVAQVAAKVAGSICCGSGDLDKYQSTVETVHNDLIERIATATAAAGATVVTQVFPGATTTAAPGLVAPPAAPAPAPAPVPAPQGLVGPITSTSNEDDKWRDALVNSPNNWFNNINDKRSPDGPDFRHKTLKDKDGKYNLGLWIKSDKFQTRAPDWVFQQLGLDIPAGYNAS